MKQIGLVGVGGWGKNILRDLRMLGAEVHAVARSEGSRDRATRGGAASLVTRAVDLPIVDGIVVATDADAHLDVVESVLDREVPVFVEKPFGTDPDQALAIAERAGDRVFVMHKWRYHPGVERLRMLLEEGVLGELQQIHLTRTGFGNRHHEDALWVLLPHDLSIVLELLGRYPEPAAATGFTVGGRPVALTALFDQPVACVIDVSARSRRRVREIQVHGSDALGVLRDGWVSEVEVYRGVPDDATGHVEAVEPDDVIPVDDELPLVRELRTFLEHLDGGPPPRSSAAEGAAETRLITRLREMAGL